MLNLALTGEQRGRVRDLAGFRKKNHRVPDETNERTQAFVGRIAASDLGDDLDERFTAFRQHLGLRRVQMDVGEPDHGCATITTPDFQYQVSVIQSEDDPAELIWKRRVADFSDVQPLLQVGFSAALGSLLDTVEFLPSDPVDVEHLIDQLEEEQRDGLQLEYDRTGSWCRLLIPSEADASMVVHAHLVELKSHLPCSPAVLLESFFAFQELLPALE